ncbi:iron complex outermembrane recepter protein [Neolewinella agarilytica]|uniref:Iron complex outermembrane recepter protein n=2 Tax=Neolewinella agarilytica TaxID=478744 RepID=A0A1H9M5H9_9BACT|nr:iron complex outermembrane recepter protein [Neolewinella agarilytica]
MRLPLLTAQLSRTATAQYLTFAPMTKLLVTLLCTCVSAFLFAQQSDTLLLYDIPTTTVTAYGAKAIEPIAAPVSRLTETELDRYDNSSLLTGLNRLPGVRFEERATASYRIAIRGASLRAPFGVRNTQVYWNGLPYGEPGGDVPLNFLDAVNVDQLEVIRGPSGGFYGPGTAGTLLLNTKRLTNEQKKTAVEAGLAAGSYGYFRGELKLESANEYGGYRQFRIGYQRTDGYRDHSAMERTTMQYSSLLGKSKEGSETRLHALYTKLDYELPGGLNAGQYEENPRQARPGSAETNASIHYHNMLIGVTHNQQLGGWRSEFSAYATGFYFDHPFNFDYKREANLGGGTRAAFTRDFTDDLALTAGAEARFQYRNGQNFGNDAGQPADLNFSDEIFSEQSLLFGQLVYKPGAWDFTLGLSSSALEYTVDRTFSANGGAGKTSFSANRPLSLRLAAGRQLGKGQYLYASRADGFSPPTLDEFRTNEGSLNVDLDPEVGTNYEVGYRYAQGKVKAEVTAFHFALDEAITSFTDERGTQLFRNAGQTRQQGLEIGAGYRALDATQGPMSLNFYGSYTYYNFTYQDFEQRGTNFSGNNIPGAAPHTLNLEISAALTSGPYLNVFHTFMDAIPLNDANDVFAESFQLLRLQIGFRRGRYDVFLTGANLLDEQMSFGNDLNPQFGGRYFQPAPGRNWQVGVRFVPPTSVGGYKRSAD